MNPDLEEFLADSGAEVRFLRHRSTGTVHIVVPRSVGPKQEFRFGEVPPDVALDFALGTTRTLCPYVGHQNVGDVLVGTFADEDLCRLCHRALGPYSARAFEHPQPKEIR